MIHYELMIASDDDDELSEYDYDEYGYEEGGAAVVRHEENGTKTEVGWIGGEPEDNTYYRTYAWIVGALNDAYKLGRQHGSRAEYDRLRDKV